MDYIDRIKLLKTEKKITNDMLSEMTGIPLGTLSKILAGNTKPFLRLIGAPYWARAKSWGNRLADVIYTAVSFCFSVLDIAWVIL